MGVIYDDRRMARIVDAAFADAKSIRVGAPYIGAIKAFHAHGFDDAAWRVYLPLYEFARPDGLIVTNIDGVIERIVPSKRS